MSRFPAEAPRRVAASEIRTLVTQFGGDENLGTSVATILHLQLWRTLRKEPHPNPKHIEFGAGTLLWSDRPIDPVMSAKSIAVSTEVQQVLWGHVHSFGNDAVVTCYLDIPSYEGQGSAEKNRGIWEIKIGAVQHTSLAIDLPQRAYAFEPIKLPMEFVAKYSVPDALVIRQGPGRGRVLGPAGTKFALVESDERFAKVRSPVGTGWIELPGLSEQKPEVVDFVGGIIRIFRGDWDGAISLFSEVIGNPQAPTALKIDAGLYTIRARSELGQDADADIAHVKSLGPPSQSSVQYVAMHIISRCYQGAPSAKEPLCPADKIRELKELLSKTRPLFADDDDWFSAVEDLLYKPDN